MSSILTSAINPIATLSDQVLSEIIVVGSGTNQLKTSLQSFKNSLLPDLRNFELLFQEGLKVIRSGLDNIQANLGNTALVLDEVAKIAGGIEALIQKESQIKKEVNSYRDKLVSNIHEVEAKDKQDLLKQQQDASEKLEGLEKEKKRLEVEIARLRVRMSQMIGNPSFAERIYGEVLVAIYSKDSVVNQISQNSRSLEEMENRVNTIERNLKNCDSLITSISQLAINKMQGIQNELSAIKAILSGQEHFLDFSDPSIALFNIQTIRDIWLFVTCYGSIGGHKSTKSLSGKRLN